MTDYQKVRCGLELEPIERLKAKKRQGTRTDIINNIKESNNFPPNFGESKDKHKEETTVRVAKQVGFGSGEQYRKAKKVYQEAP